MPETVLAALILVPVLATYFLKSNAALSFLTVCVSFVLSTSVIGDLKSLLSQLNLSTTSSTISLIILVLPLVLTLLLTRRAAGSGFKFYLQLLTALCAGGLLALSVGPVLSNSSGIGLTTSSFWTQLLKIQSIVIGVGAFFSLVLVWLGTSPKHKK